MLDKSIAAMNGFRKFWRVDKNAMNHMKHFTLVSRWWISYFLLITDCINLITNKILSSSWFKWKSQPYSIKLSNTLIKRSRLYWLRTIFARSCLSDKKCYLIIIMITYNVWLILLRLRYNDVIATSRVGFLILPC